RRLRARGSDRPGKPRSAPRSRRSRLDAASAGADQPLDEVVHAATRAPGRTDVKKDYRATYIQVDAALPDLAKLAKPARALAAGQLVAFPTDTVYGLGANALEDAAVAKIFAAKGRPASNPLIVH